MKAYVATIQLLIVANTQAEACDGVSAILELADINLKDWAYLRVRDYAGKWMFSGPFEVEIADGDYEEGDFLTEP